MRSGLRAAAFGSSGARPWQEHEASAAANADRAAAERIASAAGIGCDDLGLTGLSLTTWSMANAQREQQRDASIQPCGHCCSRGSSRGAVRPLRTSATAVAGATHTFGSSTAAGAGSPMGETEGLSIAPTGPASHATTVENGRRRGAERACSSMQGGHTAAQGIRGGGRRSGGADAAGPVDVSVNAELAREPLALGGPVTRDTRGAGNGRTRRVPAGAAADRTGIHGDGTQLDGPPVSIEAVGTRTRTSSMLPGPSSNSTGEHATNPGSPAFLAESASANGDLRPSVGRGAVSRTAAPRSGRPEILARPLQRAGGGDRNGPRAASADLLMLTGTQTGELWSPFGAAGGSGAVNFCRECQTSRPAR